MTIPARIALLALLAGCPVHEVGLVHPGDPPTLERMDGEVFRLRLDEGSAPLGRLDGHTAEVWGGRTGKTIAVDRWRVPEGLHGLQIWVGVLERRGSRLGMHDVNTDAFYMLNSTSSEDLAPFLGKTVLVEGWTEGAHLVAVMYYREL